MEYAGVTIRLAVPADTAGIRRGDPDLFDHPVLPDRTGRWPTTVYVEELP
jgi:hypothetical protein